MGCAATASIVLLGTIGGLVACIAWAGATGILLSVLLGLLALGCVVTIVVGVEMAFAKRWQFSSSDGSLHGQTERMFGLRGGMGVILATESTVARAPRATSSIDAEGAGFDNVVAGLEKRGRVVTATNSDQARAFVARALAALTGMSARGEVALTLERETVWRKRYGRRAVVGEPRLRTVIARTGTELPTGDLEGLIHAVLTGTEAVHRMASATPVAVYREAHARSELRMSLVGVLYELDRERLAPRSTENRPARADQVAAAIDEFLCASPELAVVLWEELIEHARLRFED